MTRYYRVFFTAEPLVFYKSPKKRKAYFMSSEIAAARACIELEIQALGMLALPATKASHTLIRNQYRRVDTHSTKLEYLIGKTETDAFLYETYNQFIQG